MTYQHTQCLIFFRPLALIDHKYGIHLQSTISRETGSDAAGVSTRTVKAVALLPVAFCNSHQSVMSHFNKIGVHIVRRRDELRLDEEEKLLMVECLLEENLKDVVDSLPMILTSNRHEIDCLHLKRIFDKTSLEFREKDASCIDDLTRLAVDGENTGVFQRLLWFNRYFCRPGKNLLGVAISNGQYLLVKLSFDHGADFNSAVDVTGDRRMPLHHAVVEENNSAIVELLLAKGAQVDARDWLRRTPLHITAGENNAKILLSHGADPEARVSERRTPLHSAASRKDDSSKLVQVLIDGGASVNPTDMYGLTPLHLVKNPESAKTLLENDADLNCEGNGKETPLLFQIDCKRKTSNFQIIKILLDYGAHIDFKFDRNMGLVINGSYVSHMLRNERVLDYLLNRCFVHVDFEYDNERKKNLEQSSELCRIFARHLVKIVSLKLKDKYSFDATDFWLKKHHRQPLSAFKKQCEMEVSRMKNRPIAGTNLNVYELLAMDEHQVVRLLRNQSVTLDTDELKKMFPTYGLMLTCAVEKGRNRFAWQEQGIVSCNRLCGDFKRMPDGIKENIVSRLSIADIRCAKKASALLS